MQNKKKILIVLLIIILISFGITVFGKQTEEISVCSDVDGFERYVCQVNEICKKQEYGLNTARIVRLEEDFEEYISIDDAESLYTENQNKIYKCGILEAQRKVYKELIEKLVNITDISGSLKGSILPKIRQKLREIQILKSENKCLEVEKKQVKKIVLDQSSLELCKYNYFLHYLSWKNKNDLNDEIFDGEDSVSFKKVNNYIIMQQNKINANLDNSIKLYNLTYKNYAQYEDYLAAHIMLELLKGDYNSFRKSLYQILHPINQVVYKIINAQNP